MKKGDKFPVSIQGVNVVDAEIEEVETDRVTLVIPATRVVMAVKTELAPEVTPVKRESDTQVIIDGLQQPDAPVAPPVEPPAGTAFTSQVDTPEVITEPADGHQAPPRPVPEHAQESHGTEQVQTPTGPPAGEVADGHTTTPGSTEAREQ